MSGGVISFYTSGERYGSEISKFWCATRPIVGETWYIPLGDYPFHDDGSLKDGRDDFVTVKILEVS